MHDQNLPPHILGIDALLPAEMTRKAETVVESARILSRWCDVYKAEFPGQLSDGEETLELPLPCLITTDLRLNQPRYVALPGIIKARSKPLEKRPPKTSSQPKTRVTRVEAPPARAAGRKVGSVEELLGALREKGVLA